MDYLKFALKTSKTAGKELYKVFREKDPLLRGTSKEVKSIYDIISDNIIKKAIEKNFPTHSYITEETGLIEKDRNFLWIVDPVDGTSNFENHNPFFSISIALWIKGEPVLGVIEAPMLQERFYAVAGKGAVHEDLLRKRRVKAVVSEVKKIDQSFFVFCEGGEENKGRITDMFCQTYPAMKDFRKLGSAALELAWVGVGRADGYKTTQICLWDVAAGLLFVKESGGQILKFDGSPYDMSSFNPLKKYDILATNGKIKI